MNPIGYIIGEVETHRFSFVTSPDIAPPRLEYIVLHGVRERVDDELREVDVLAQVTRLQVASQMLDDSHTYEETAKLVKADYNPQPKILGTATVLGYLYREGNRSLVRVPRSAPLPGMMVHSAPDDLLEEFFCRNIQSGIPVGTLLNRPRVPVALDPNGLRRHLAIIAQTGAGKSYLSGLVLENLLQLGGTIIVFDPNSDYVRLRKTPQRTPTSFAHRVGIYRVPGVEGRRYSNEEIGGAKEYTVKFSDLEPDELCGLAGIADNAVNIRHAVKNACDKLKADGRDYRPDDLKRRLEKMAGMESAPAPLPAVTVTQVAPEDIDPDEDVFGLDAPADIYEAVDQKIGKRGTKKEPETGNSLREGAEKAVKYIEALAAYKIWGFKDVPMDDLLEPMRLSVVDLAGMEQYVAQYAVMKTLKEIWRRATTGNLTHPVFVVLEEAHNYVPGNNKYGAGECAKWINRVAAEGRKFKVFLVVITQRPGKIDPDTLSQCGSQIIMKLTNPDDQQAVRKASESLSESLFSDLPGLNTGEAIVLGQLTRVPVLIRVDGRVSAEGGSDIDVVAALETAKGALRTQEIAKQGTFATTQRTERAEEI